MFHALVSDRARYRRGVRSMVATAALVAAACGAPPGPPQDAPSTSSDRSDQVNPARIDRVRGELPAGYEVADIGDPTAPVDVWGYGGEWTAEPPRCAVLADPVADATTTAGWAASGPGGIVYAVIAGSAHPVHLDPAVLDECGRWTLSGGRASGSVTFTPAPAIDGAATVATATETTTVVEGGTKTHSHAETITAYLGGYVAFVAVVTDPGSPNRQLGHDFAAALMVETVSALRG